MRNRAAGDSIADTEPPVLARACSAELNRLGIREIGPFPIYSAPLGRAGLLPCPVVAPHRRGPAENWASCACIAVHAEHQIDAKSSLRARHRRCKQRVLC